MPVVLVELLAILGPWIMRFFAVKGVIMVAGFLARIGVVLMTDRMVVQPALDAIMNAMGAMPPEFNCWFGVIGIKEAVSICVSGITLITANKIFFGKKES